MTNVLALDLGASSGRAIVGNLEDGRITLKEISRFENTPTYVDERLSWNTDELFNQIKLGITEATEKYAIESLGIDTWGVDFGLLDKYGNLIELPTHYRGVKAEDILKKISDFISLQDLYDSTGNQVMQINTLFQLLSLKQNRPELFINTRKVLLISDLFNYFLTGQMATERSIASTTQLTNPYSKEWSKQIIENFNLTEQLFPEIVDEGNILGPIKPTLNLGNARVINVCQHDTASAVLSIPAEKPFLFISCGTWSLIGTELDHPILNKKAMEYNLTNESGYGKTTEFLKNCTGLWIIQELKRNYQADGFDYSFEDITELVLDTDNGVCQIDTETEGFRKPGDMRQRIVEYAQETGQIVPQTVGEFFKCVYESLAMEYDATIKEIEDATGESYADIHIVGGGSKSKYFCQLVADTTGKNVLAGPAEATALGNVLIQLISLKKIKDVTEARRIVANSVKITKYQPAK